MIRTRSPVWRDNLARSPIPSWPRFIPSFRSLCDVIHFARMQIVRLRFWFSGLRDVRGRERLERECRTSGRQEVGGIGIVT